MFILGGQEFTELPRLLLFPFSFENAVKVGTRWSDSIVEEHRLLSKLESQKSVLLESSHTMVIGMWSYELHARSTIIMFHGF